MSRSLAEWLAYQEGTHPREIALGLDRVRTVWQAMGAPRPAPLVITVGGTNGKGSTVAFLEGMLRAAGYRVGCYTSPHLLRYNERVRIEGEDATDEALVAAFERIEAARGAIPQTYFEFGTLAAIDLMARAALDIAVIEVGLGGRLDAVNIVDADVAVITTIDLDHQDWLGGDRDSIGREKAGIARAGRPAVIGERSPPAGLVQALRGIGADVVANGTAFSVRRMEGDPVWQWSHRDGTLLDLPYPRLDAPVQVDNAATAIAAIHALGARVDVNPGAIRHALTGVRVPGRLQRVAEHPLTLVDVGHNPQAARALAAWLDATPRTGRVRAVYGALADKDVGGVIEALVDRVDQWYLAGLDRDTPRGLPAAALAGSLAAVAPKAAGRAFADVASAWTAARAEAGEDDVLLLFGSFFVAAAALSHRT
ncbi:MAG TPA: bifunctional tetrahydrofolate synthase/dihydrofolate synthase [Luteibacter sp.]|uniref:bifunctional tetrahydrofolate synthase/dihydrofolate synthase n=1 Tax=Luteibacter sp. TaxID=1886636 RepID=UPI002C61DD91|nr:bifunctional tetrahydrofolate synthase/dihydrofolate synthase [Luteibacter sp.]HVI54353.1 bifunctional tetrahydrofolate synthase/dihydrofolate synthase [Luteibacter sp.]